MKRDQGEIWRIFIVKRINREGQAMNDITVRTPEEAVGVAEALADLPGDQTTVIIEYREPKNDQQQERIFFNPHGMALRAEDWRSFLQSRKRG